jgi:hypothetical protein
MTSSISIAYASERVASSLVCVWLCMYLNQLCSYNNSFLSLSPGKKTYKQHGTSRTEAVKRGRCTRAGYTGRSVVVIICPPTPR